MKFKLLGKHADIQIILSTVKKKVRIQEGGNI